MHERRGPGLMQPAIGDVMVHCQNLENSRYAIVNIYVFLFSWVFISGPYSTKPVKPLCRIQNKLPLFKSILSRAKPSA